MAKYSECATRFEEQGHARSDITELDMFTDLREEEEEFLTDNLDDCRQVLELGNANEACRAGRPAQRDDSVGDEDRAEH